MNVTFSLVYSDGEGCAVNSFDGVFVEAKVSGMLAACTF
jgi:hypothetical protein